MIAVSILAKELSPEEWRKLMVALAILMGIVIVGGIVLVILRSRLYAKNSETQEHPGFSLSDLRAMRDRGEITPGEYEVARNRIVYKVRSSLEKKPKEEQTPEAGMEE